MEKKEEEEEEEVGVLQKSQSWCFTEKSKLVFYRKVSHSGYLYCPRYFSH